MTDLCKTEGGWREQETGPGERGANQQKKQIKYSSLYNLESFNEFKNNRNIDKESIISSFTNSGPMDSRANYVDEYNKNSEEISTFELYQILKEAGIEYGVSAEYKEIFAAKQQ